MYLQKKPHVNVLLGGLLSLCASVQATPMSSSNITPPDAGSLQHQIEQSLPSNRPSLQHQATPTPESSTSSDAVTVTVREFKFKGNTLIDEAHLREVVQPFLNRPLSFNQLKQAAQAVANAYRDAGWVVRAFLPKQEIDQGVVTIEIVEAVFGQTSFSDTSFHSVQATRLRSIVEAAQPHGQPLQSENIDRALLLLDDLPGVSVVGNLTPGQLDGETDLLLTVTDEPLINGSVTTDNEGSTSTGTTRLLSSVNLNSPLHLADSLTAFAMKTQSSAYARMTYSVPMGAQGWRAGVHASTMNYSLIGDFASSNLSGTSSTSGVDGTYPIIRSPLQNLNLSLAYDLKKFDNLSPANPTDYQIDALNINLSGNRIDNWAGGGSNNASVVLTRGNVNLNGSSNQSTDAATANTQGFYNKVGLSMNRLQTITSDLSGFVSLTGQAANKNLDSSEKIYLGGANGVRAYPSSEGSGTQGYVATTELRARIGAHSTVATFYDYGYVTAYKYNDYAAGTGGLNTGTNPNNYALKGFGFSLGWQSLQGIDIKATVARRVGDNPIANATTGMDGDGTKIINRFWLSASMTF